MDQLCDPSCVDRIILDQKDLERALLSRWRSAGHALTPEPLSISDANGRSIVSSRFLTIQQIEIQG